MNSVAGDNRIALSRIVVIDDHVTFADLLAGALNRETDLQCVGTANTLEDGVAFCFEFDRTWWLSTTECPMGTGFRAPRRILEALPSTRIVMLTGDPTPQAMQRAADMGFAGSCRRTGH